MIAKLGQVTENTRGCCCGIEPDSTVERTKLYTDGDGQGPHSIVRTPAFPFTVPACR